MKTKIIGHFLCTNKFDSICNDVTCRQSGQKVTSGMRLIAEEQCRQKKRKILPLEQNEYTDGRGALMAACYAEFANLSSSERVEQTLAKDSYWPWDEKWWKPKSSLQDLVQAAVLIAAEIDRLIKLEPQYTDEVSR